MIDVIIKIAALLSALGVIIAAAAKVFKTANKVLDKIDGFERDMKCLKEHSNENYMSLLRLTIMSSEIPIGERIVAGYKYLEKGGNGEIKKFLEEEFNIRETVDEASHYKP